MLVCIRRQAMTELVFTVMVPCSSSGKDDVPWCLLRTESDTALYVQGTLVTWRNCGAPGGEVEYHSSDPEVDCNAARKKPPCHSP